MVAPAARKRKENWIYKYKAIHTHTKYTTLITDSLQSLTRTWIFAKPFSLVGSGYANRWTS